MASDDQRKIFRQQALEQLSSPEQLDQLLQVTSRKSWIAIGTLAAGVLAALVWSVLGQIPITVDGTGILVHPRRVVSLQSPASGRIVSLDVAVGDEVRRGDVIATISQPELAQQLEQERVRLTETRSRNTQTSAMAGQRLKLQREGIERKRALLRDRIASLQSSADTQRQRSERYVAEQRANVMQTRKVQETVGKALEERYRSYLELKKEGLSSQDVVLDARQRVLDNQLQRADLDLQIQQIELRRLEAEERYQQQMDQVEELRAQLQDLDIEEAQLAQQEIETSADRELRIQELQRNIERLEAELAGKGQVTSEFTGRVLEVTVGPGQIVAAGQRIGAVEAIDPEGKLVGVAYFSVGDGKKIVEGMEVRITPSTVERERFGSMKAVVTSASTFPVTTDAVASVIGHREVAGELTQGTSRIQVFAELESDPATATGYRWTSGGGPPDPVTAGTTTAVRATVEYRRPITFVIPILRRWSGTG
ncbi:MAG: NHLP bacteriocin system secretion protein [Ectothiorhodospiraceae bacterium]|nr:NHLP bacteriocin system secretion protein [Ectothiorhodospiraceae bacterium]